MITRRKNYTKQAPTRDARKLYIFCEGVGTEPSYFSFFEGLSTNLEIITVPPESGTDPLKLLELAKSKLLANIKEGLVFSREGDCIWQCANCGHIVIGPKAPDICPVCDHPQSYFQLKPENY